MRVRRSATVLTGLLALGALAFYVRVYVHSAPIVWADSCAYLSAARSLATDGTFAYRLVALNPRTLKSVPETDRVGWWPPLYPAAIALAAGDGSDDPDKLLAATATLNLAGQIVAVVGVGLIVGLATGSAAAGFLGCVLYTLCAPAVWEAPRVVSEHLFMPLAILALTMQLLAARREDWGASAVAGVLWGLACLTRHLGLVMMMCGAAATWFALSHLPTRRRLKVTVPTVLIGGLMWAVWAARNYAIEGRPIGGHYAQGGYDLGTQIVSVLMGYGGGFSTIPWAPALFPLLRTALAFTTGVLLVLGWLVALRWLLGPARTDTTASGVRWLAWFGLLCVSSALALTAVTEAAHHINAPMGRLMLPAAIGTILALAGVASKSRPMRLVVGALVICVIVGGVELGASRLCLPGSARVLRRFRALSADQRLRDAARGKTVLLMHESGLRPVVSLLRASVFLPEAKTVFWVDDPLYTGVVVGPEEVARVALRAPLDLILTGPSQRDLVRDLYAYSQPPTGALAARRAALRARCLALTERNAARMDPYERPLRLTTREVLRVGQWRLLDVGKGAGAE